MSMLGWENSPSLFLQFSKHIQKLLYTTIIDRIEKC